MNGYTVLRVTEGFTIPLLHRHATRLGGEALGALQHFISFVVEPGVYRVTWDGRQLSTLKLPGSRLVEGITTRVMTSPFAELHGRFPKPGSPSPYDAVRLDGVSTLLTDPSGIEVFEACSAAIVAWNGSELVLPPEDRPAVASLAEAAIAKHEAVVRAPIRLADAWPLLLVNAVTTCVPNGSAFPPTIRERLADLLVKEDA